MRRAPGCEAAAAGRHGFTCRGAGAWWRHVDPDHPAAACPRGPERPTAGTHGDGPVVQYSAPADTNPGREAWLVGGGDNAEVVYGRR